MTYIDKIKADAAYQYEVSIDDIEIIEDIEGYGVHVHDASCQKDGESSIFRRCVKHFDDSDRIVTIRYNDRGHQAVYGVLDGDVTLWMD